MFKKKPPTNFLSRFACELNEMEEGVAPTDSRRRPDQRLMENGQWDEANTEKVHFISGSGAEHWNL